MSGQRSRAAGREAEGQRYQDERDPHGHQLTCSDLCASGYPDPVLLDLSVLAATATDAVRDALVVETIHILREAAGAFRRPVLLYSIGRFVGSASSGL